MSEKIAKAILDGNGDYLLAVKGNQNRLEQAYDNLQGMLGADGIKGLTSETTKLVQQQQGLMESLKGMGPMMKEAKSMMAGMKDMGSLESMKDMKAIVNSMAAKK